MRISDVYCCFLRRHSIEDSAGFNCSFFPTQYGPRGCDQTHLLVFTTFSSNRFSPVKRRWNTPPESIVMMNANSFLRTSSGQALIMASSSSFRRQFTQREIEVHQRHLTAAVQRLTNRSRSWLINIRSKCTQRRINEAKAFDKIQTCSRHWRRCRVCAH